jgi:DNA-binding HxlR family transcriptional regulator
MTGRLAVVVGRRKYDEGCAVSHALDLIGERWALLVVRELLLGPKRFTDLRAGVPGASPDVLANRLRELQEAGVVRQRKLPPPAGSQVYELTDWGAELEPVVTVLGRWGSRSPSLPHEAHSSIDSLLLSLRSLFDPQAARGLNAAITLRVEARPFHVEIIDNELRLAGGEARQPTATLETDRQILAALLHGERRLADALHAGEATVTGSIAVVARFLELFPLPEPA